MSIDSSRRNLLIAMAATGLSGLSNAEAYPGKAITMILPTSAGSALDATARQMTPALGQALGQPVVVENRAGAGGIIGNMQIIKSAPDGYTVGLVSSSYCITPALQPISYDPLRDIQPVSVLSSGPMVLVANPANVPAIQLRPFIALARQRAASRPLSIGNAGNGTTVQLAAAQLEVLSSTKMNHVPYRAITTYATDLISGVVDAGFLPVSVALPFVKDGRLRAIGLSTSKRVDVLPDVPTLDESGLPGFNVDGWVALLVPARVPRQIVERLHKEVVTVARDPAFTRFVNANGGYVIGSSIEEAEATFARELAEASKAIKQLGIKAE